MDNNESVTSICGLERLDLVFTIVSRGKGEYVVDVLREHGIFQNTICHGHGTAPSKILEKFGLGATEKDVVLTFVRHERSHDILELISRKLDFEKPGNGITFTVPLQSVAGMIPFKFLTAEYPEEV